MNLKNSFYVTLNSQKNRVLAYINNAAFSWNVTIAEFYQKKYRVKGINSTIRNGMILIQHKASL